jgi:hypothetical protein
MFDPESITEDNWVEKFTEYLDALDNNPDPEPLKVTVRETLTQAQQDTLRQLRDALPAYRMAEEV